MPLKIFFMTAINNSVSFRIRTSDKMKEAVRCQTGLHPSLLVSFSFMSPKYLDSTWWKTPKKRKTFFELFVGRIHYALPCDETCIHWIEIQKKEK